MNAPIAIFTDDPGWHGARLLEAFAARGREARYVSLNDCTLALAEGGGEVLLPGFAGLPAACFVRGVPGGSLEQVVSALNVLHALGELGVPVYNHGRAIERSVDKAYTSLRLRRAGVATPDTWVSCDRGAAERVVTARHAAGETLVLKPLFGSQGRDVIRLEPGRPLPASPAYRGVWYLQRYLASRDGGDYRVFVVGGRALAAMRRCGGGWVSNVARGAECLAVPAEGELARLAERAAAALAMDYAGVDLLRDRDGRLWVLEVNSVPAWKGLQSVTALDIAGVLADDLLHRTRARLEAVS